MDNKLVLSLLACLFAGIFIVVGIFIEKKDLFSKLYHPLVERYPNISKVFGRVFIGFALVWLAGFLLVMLMK